MDVQEMKEMLLKANLENFSPRQGNTLDALRKPVGNVGVGNVPQAGTPTKATPRPTLRGEVANLSLVQSAQWIRVIIAGDAKSSGKTTFALQGPGKKLHLAYDGGLPPRGIPGVDEELVWSVQYAASQQDMKFDSDKWVRDGSRGERMLADIQAIRNAFVKGEQEITFGDNTSTPLPDVIIMDGVADLADAALNWLLKVNNKTDPEEFDNNFIPWQKRLKVMQNIMNMVLPLPVHVVLVTWETKEMVNQRNTGMIIPDIGGKLDEVLPRKMDMALRAYAKVDGGKLRYMMQVKRDAQRTWVGVRGRYDDVMEVDVTVKQGMVGPGSWEKVFGKELGTWVRPEQPRANQKVMEVTL